MAYDDVRSYVEFFEALNESGKFGRPYSEIDYAGSYGEPGYSDGETLVVMGDWWCECGATGYYDGDGAFAGKGKLHDVMGEHFPTLLKRMDDNGVRFEWHDEWVVVPELDKAYRTEPDSYSWQPSAILGEDCEWMTIDDDADLILEWATDEETRCIPANFLSATDLIERGWEKYDRTYANGWHPGQDDNPKEIAAAIREYHGEDTPVVFYLDSTGQFNVHFSAWFKRASEDEEVA